VCLSCFGGVAADNEATDGIDFQHINAQLEFGPSTPVGQIKCVNVATRADSVFEGVEETRIFIKTNSSSLRPNPLKSLIKILDSNSEFLHQLASPNTN